MNKYTYIGRIGEKTYIIDIITTDSERAYQRLKELRNSRKFDEVFVVKERVN